VRNDDGLVPPASYFTHDFHSLRFCCRSKYIKPVFTSDVVKQNWDPAVSAAQNLARIGLAVEGNKALDNKRKVKAKASATEFFGKCWDCD